MHMLAGVVTSSACALIRMDANLRRHISYHGRQCNASVRAFNDPVLDGAIDIHMDRFGYIFKRRRQRIGFATYIRANHVSYVE